MLNFGIQCVLGKHLLVSLIVRWQLFFCIPHLCYYLLILKLITYVGFKRSAFHFHTNSNFLKNSFNARIKETFEDESNINSCKLLMNFHWWLFYNYTFTTIMNSPFIQHTWRYSFILAPCVGMLIYTIYNLFLKLFVSNVTCFLRINTFSQ